MRFIRARSQRGRLLPSRGAVALIATAGVLAAGIGIANAQIPDQNGTITGCYNADGVLSVIDTATTPSCPSGTTQLTWNQQGPQGPQGPSGSTVHVANQYHDNAEVLWSGPQPELVASPPSPAADLVEVVRVGPPIPSGTLLHFTGTVTSTATGCKGITQVLSGCGRSSTLDCFFRALADDNGYHGDFRLTVPPAGSETIAGMIVTPAYVPGPGGAVLWDARTEVSLYCWDVGGPSLQLTNFVVTTTSP